MGKIFEKVVKRGQVYWHCRLCNRYFDTKDGIWGHLGKSPEHKQRVEALKEGISHGEWEARLKESKRDIGQVNLEFDREWLEE